MSRREFTRLTGYNHVSLGEFIKGKTKNPTLSLIVGFNKVFPDVDLHWLITGQGTPPDYARGAGGESVEREPVALKVSEGEGGLIRELLDRLEEMDGRLKELEAEVRGD